MKPTTNATALDYANREVFDITVQARISKRMKKKLDMLAGQLNTKGSDIIRSALNFYFDRVSTEDKIINAAMQKIDNVVKVHHK